MPRPTRISRLAKACRKRACVHGLSHGGSRTSFPARFRPSSARGHLVAGGGRPVAGDPGLHPAVQSARGRGSGNPSARCRKQPRNSPAPRAAGPRHGYARACDQLSLHHPIPSCRQHGADPACPSHFTPSDQSLIPPTTCDRRVSGRPDLRTTPGSVPRWSKPWTIPVPRFRTMTWRHISPSGAQQHFARRPGVAREASPAMR
jgi:hypothetical protein